MNLKKQLEELVKGMYCGGERYPDAVVEFKKTFIGTVLASYNGNQCKAARALGMHRNTLRRTMEELKIKRVPYATSTKRPSMATSVNQYDHQRQA